MNIENFYQALDNFFMEKKIHKAELFLKDTLSEAEAAEDFGLIIVACNELGGLYRVRCRRCLCMKRLWRASEESEKRRAKIMQRR